MTAVRRGTVAVPVLLLAMACSGGSRDFPDIEEFTAGTCRDAAGAVIALDEQTHRALREDVETAEVRATLKSEQGRLLELLPRADGDVAERLQQVVTRAGFARAALDTGTLTEAVVQDLSSAVDDFVAACVPTTGAAP